MGGLSDSKCQLSSTTGIYQIMSLVANKSLLYLDSNPRDKKFAEKCCEVVNPHVSSLAVAVYMLSRYALKN